MEEVTEETTLRSENIPQKKILFWQNPKIPIVAALVVVALGILGVGINLYLKTIMPLPPTPSLPFLKEVTITTDKTEYEQGEVVKITIRNESNNTKWIHYPFWIVENFEKGSWKEINRVSCPCGVSCRISSYWELEPNKTIKDEWNQKETWCKEGMPSVSEATASEQVLSGKYRLKIKVSNSEKNALKKTIYSNEFTIKEKESGEECYQDPREALDNFLSYLHNGHYENAAKLYHRESDFGGYYPNQRPFPPGATEEERIKIEARGLADFCRGYGTCLEHRIVSEKVSSGDTVLFGVQFLEENGELFELVVPPVAQEGVDKSVATEFGLRVVEIDGCHKSLSVPPMGP